MGEGCGGEGRREVSLRRGGEGREELMEEERSKDGKGQEGRWR
jgi:hypothetical protein